VSQELFDRIAVLTVYRAITETITQADGTKGILVTGYENQGKQFKSRLDSGAPGFRIRFSCKKTMSLSPNFGTMAIYNVNEESRSFFERTNNLITLEVGYGNSPKLIFKGNVGRGRTSKVGPDYVTNIEAQDGLYAVQNSKIDQSFNPGIAKNAAINSMVDAIAAVPGMAKGQIFGLPNDGYNQGVVLSGPAMDRLKEVCDGNNLNFFVDDHKVYILPVGTAKDNPPVKLSVDTGLIGIPERGNGRLSLRSLLNPEISLLQLVELKSKFVNGLFVANQVVNTGDTYGLEWYSEIECNYPGSDEAAF
jgi:hypothetical protein